MIDANELRLGNWVKYNYDIGNNASREEKVDIDILDEILSGHNPFDYEPIPLTPEILKKSKWSFDSDDDATWYEHLSDNGVLFCEGNKNGITEVFLDMQDSIRVRYLHQLQNLYFSLTGTELEIKF